MSGEQIVFKRGIYDKDKFLNSSSSAIPHNKGHFYLATANTYSSHLIYDDGVNFLEVIPSLLGEANGGTGEDLTTIAPYSTLIQNSTSTKVEGVESLAGAYYSTANGVKPQFGILPYNLGGTGNTDYTVNTLIFADSNKKLKSIAKTTVSSNQISITDTNNTTTTAFNVRNKDGGVSLRAATFTGLYDQVNSSWIINKTQATDTTAAEVRIPAWSSTGDGKKIIYFNSNGKPVISSSTVGSGIKPIYLSSGTITESSSTVGSGTKPIYMSSGTITPSSSTVGSASRPVYMSSGTITQITTLATAYGGTGNTSFTANRVIYSSSATTLSSSSHYSSATAMGINSSSVPSGYIFYVNGATGINGKLTLINDTSKPSAGTILPVLAIKYNNGSDSVYTSNLISAVGTGNTADTYNASYLINAGSGSLVLSAGENGNSMVQTLALYDNENLYLTSDSSISAYVNCSNDATSYIKGFEINKDGFYLYDSSNITNCYTDRTNGTNTVNGEFNLKLGNNIASGVLGNARGKLTIYGAEAYGHVITSNAASSAKYISIPNYGGNMTISVGSINPSTASTKYIPFYNSTDQTIGYNNGFRYLTLEGTTSAFGYGYLVLGNNTASGTEGNKYGALRLYSDNTGYVDIRTGTSSTSNYTLYLPGASGQFVYHPNDTIVGSTDRPVYIASTGRATICNTPSSEAWWQGVPYVTNTGVIEIGKYLDFHNVSTNTNDYSTRIDCASNTANILTLPSGTGTLAILNKGSTSYWGIRGPANDDVWIRTTSNGFIPDQSGSVGSGHASLGTSSWYFANSYIDNMYVNLAASKITYVNDDHKFVTMANSSIGSNSIKIGNTGSATKAYVQVENSNGKLALYTDTNRGLWDDSNSKWMIRINQAGNSTYIPNWSSKGSASLPVYFNSDGMPVACTGSSVFSALSWTAGTTAGPVLNATIAGYARTATIPSASASASGAVTTGAQSFAGAKTFTANTTYYNTLLESTNSIAYWGNPTLNMGLSTSSLYIAGADNSGAVDLGSSSRRWKGLYIAGNVNSGGYDVIRNYNNGNITVNAASSTLYLGYTTTTQIISYQNHSINGYLKVNSTAVAAYALDVNGTIKFTKRLIGASGTDSVYGSSLPATSNSTTGQIFFKIG